MNNHGKWKAQWQGEFLHISGETDEFPNDFSTPRLVRKEENETEGVLSYQIDFALDKEPYCNKDLVGPVNHWDKNIPKGTKEIRIYSSKSGYLQFEIPH